MSQEDAIRLLQKYGKANENMRLLKELLVKSSAEIAQQDVDKRQMREQIAGLEFEVRVNVFPSQRWYRRSGNVLLLSCCCCCCCCCFLLILALLLTICLSFTDADADRSER